MHNLALELLTGITLQEIVAAADEVIGAIDTAELAMHVARKTPLEVPGADKKKKELDEKKSALVDALTRKCKALLEIEGVAPKEETGAETEEVQVCEQCHCWCYQSSIVDAISLVKKSRVVCSRRICVHYGTEHQPTWWLTLLFHVRVAALHAWQRQLGLC